ncbi:mitochondrial 37S ribosomal protein mS38 QRI5 [Sporobolomyces salmoneus]|uniref:mitochondrial 37S ribosomal protein mS38 QRI5 n=1 Tax=Sporobolomyces salmoneus TaxID=183962 RepID=UPI003181C593
MRFSRALRPNSAYFSPSYGSILARPSPNLISSSPLASPSSLSLSTSARPCRRYSCSSNSSGRSSSRDGSSSRVKAPTATRTPSSSSSPSPVAPKPVQVATRISPTPSTYNLPHVSAELVKFDSLFSLHRPLLELPVQLQNRRSINNNKHENDSAASIAVAAEQLETRMEETRTTLVVEEGGENEPETITVAELSDELAEVVDLSEDGTPIGTPYLARMGSFSPLKTVEEELAAEAKEEEALAMHEEQLHDMEKDEAEPYDAWMIGQHEPLPHQIARYLALRPPHQAPQSSIDNLSPPPPLPSKTLADLNFLSPFGKPSSSPSSTSPSSLSSLSSTLPVSPYASAFSKHFLRPLDPTDAAAVADQFLSHHQLVHTWSARTDFVDQAAESLRKAQQSYSSSSSDSPIVSVSTPVVARGPTEKGTIKYWTEGRGWETFDFKTGVTENGSPFLPAEMVELDGGRSVEDIVVEMDSTKRKRKKKITKHKYKKRRKAQRALRQRLGK